jgi:Tfp pilus assembly protein PilV
MKRRKAFSIAELLIAVFVLAVGILAILACFVVGHRSVEYSGQVTQALNAGRQIVELIRSRNLINFSAAFPSSDTSGLFDAPQVRRNIDSPPFEGDITPNSSLKRNITITRLSADSLSYKYNMARIKVKVFWWDRKVEKNVEIQAYHRQL